MQVIHSNFREIQALCDHHKVKELYVFGSVLTPSFTEKSDIDVLVLFEPMKLEDYFDNYMDLKEKLRQLLAHEIDLVENQAIKNPIFRRIVDRDKQLVYERKSA
ncbi:MAG: nucleotidyltransferase family protein [Flavobacteriales bacterium]|jgi:predicted nucleotidyltransferase